MNDEQRRADLRKKWRAYYDACDRISEAHKTMLDASENCIPRPRFLPFPDALRGLTCGAKTRAGTPCKQKSLYRSGRCKLHGGMSTGPTSDEGRRIVSQNWCRGKAHEG